ncbi:Cyclic nucleotide-binding-like [Phytophthora cactorum]|nr:Cyclic nucleotide-binding-like [Phytophthora cactorum]
MSAHDVVSSAAVEEKESLELSQVLENDGDETASDSAKPFNRLVTTSALAAALAEVERSKRRRLNRRHSGGLEPPVESDKHSTDAALAVQLPNSGHRMSAPSIDAVPTVSTEVAIKPLRQESVSPRSQLKRATGTHLAGMRERRKAGKQPEATAPTIKRTPSAATMPTFKRMPSSGATPSFRAVAKAVAVSGNSTTATNDPGQNYEQMMARFQLRRLEFTGSGRNLDNEAKTIHRRSLAYMAPVDSEMSQPRIDDVMHSTHRRSEGEYIDNTIGREGDRDILATSQSRVDSQAEESPRRPGAPSFHSNNASIAPPATASVAPVDYLGSTNGALGNSMRSIASAVKIPQSSALEPDQTRVSQQQEKTEQRQQWQQRQSPAARKESGGVLNRDLASFQKFSPGSRPRPLPRFKKRTRSFYPVAGLLRAHTGFPYEEAFHNGGRAWFISVDSLTEMVFFADFLLAFNTSYVNKRGVLVVSRRHIAWNFLTGACVFQFLAALPSTTVGTIMKGGAEGATQIEIGNDAIGRFSHTLLDIILRSHRVVHILRLLREAGQVRGARIDKSVWGWLLLLLIDSADVDPASSVDRTCGAAIDSSVEFEMYAECFYVAMQLLQGQSLTTHSVWEDIFASGVNLLGSIVLAVIFGHVAMLVANFNANSTAYQRKMESVFAGMTKMQLPAPLRERIHQYYAHLWREYEALDGAPLERFAKELSHNLTLEVVLFKYMELAMHVPFWENCSPDFQKTLVLSLDTRVYLPDDFIVRRGEVGDEFYMINRGMCELVGSKDTQEHATEPLARRRSQLGENSEHPGDTSTLYTTSHDGTVYPDDDHGRRARVVAQNSHVNPEGHTPTVKTLTRGQAFGEMALLMNYPRTANVRAMTYVEMCVLSRTAFQAVLTRYPVDRKHVISQILISSLENNERFGIPCPLTAMARSVFADEVDGVANGEKFITPRRAAKLVAWAVNPDVEDDSIKFALSNKLKDQLVVVRDQEFGASTHLDEDTPGRTVALPLPRSSHVGSGARKRGGDDENQKECGCTCHCSSHPTPKISSKPEPEVDSQVVKLESVQAQALSLIQELQRGVQDTLHPTHQPSQLSTVDASSVPDQGAPNGVPTNIPTTSTTSTKPVITIQQRRSKFINSRSTSAPNFADLDLASPIPTRTLNEVLWISPNLSGNAITKAKPAVTPPKPIQRAMTARWLKTSENTRPLRLQNSFTPLVRPRAPSGSSSQRFIQRVTHQLASLATSSNSTVQASPTRYADQLFGTAHSSQETAPGANEMSFREDSNVSEARY